MSGLINSIKSLFYKKDKTLKRGKISPSGQVLEEVHQDKNNTSYNRYPIIFQGIKDYCDDVYDSLPILSYGCSTGEECFTIRNDYLRLVPIIGVDIDENNLKIACDGNPKDSGITFLFSDNGNLLSNAPYQVILCMSVLCRWPDTENMDDISSLYTFEKFQSKLEELHSLLNIGGLLVIYNANFRFCDTTLYEKYKVFKVNENPENEFVHKFDKTNQKIISGDYMEWIFIKTQE